MKIRLDLSRHCIETEIKKQHNNAIAAYFKADRKAKRRLEPTVEMTGRALETLNFACLRTQYPPLAGGTSREVTLSWENEDWVIAIDGITLKDQQGLGETPLPPGTKG